MLDLQKAGIFKRFSAWLCDIVLLAVVTIGALLLGMLITNYDDYSNHISERKAYYETKYGEEIIYAEDVDALTPEQKALREQAEKELEADAEALNKAQSMVYNLSVTLPAISLFIAFMLLEFLVPMLFGNGQTVGKKIFGVGVMKTNSTKITPQILFVRAILGKYTMETMVPVAILLLIYSGFLGGVLGLIVIALIWIFNIVLVIATKTNSAIHDVLSYTVTVELASQRIFENEEALLEYKKKLHAEAAESAKY